MGRLPLGSESTNEARIAELERIVNGLLNSDNILDGAISSTKIADGSVSNAKLATGAVASTKYAAATMSAIESLDGGVTTGALCKTGASSVALRTITGTSNAITVTNGNGVSGDPTIDLPTTISGARKIGDASNYVELDPANGNINLAGTGRDYVYLPFLSVGAASGATAGAVMGSWIDGSTVTRTFGCHVQELWGRLDFATAIDLVAAFEVGTTQAGTNAARLTVDATYLRDGTTTSQSNAIASASQTVTWENNFPTFKRKDVTLGTITANTLQANDWVGVTIARVGGDAADTMTGTLYLRGLWLKAKRSKV